MVYDNFGGFLIIEILSIKQKEIIRIPTQT